MLVSCEEKAQLCYEDINHQPPHLDKKKNMHIKTLKTAHTIKTHQQ